MAYSTSGLRQIVAGAVNVWALDTVDSVATASGAGYITDATSSSTNGTPGRGMRVGDLVIVRVVGALGANGTPPATCTDQAWAFVSGLNAATGAGSLTAT